MTGVLAGPAGPRPAPEGAIGPQDVLLPGAAPRLRAVEGVSGPQDVPPWMCRGGGAVRGAAAALASDAVVVRRVAETLRSALFDTATALGWQGTASRVAQARARGVHGRLGVVAGQLDAAATALSGLAAALDAQQPVLGAASAAWARASDPPQQLGLLRQWQPSVRALDDADRRASEALRSVGTALGRVRGALTGADAGPGDGPGPGEGPGDGGQGPRGPGRGLLDRVADYVGTACAETVNGLASLANAAGQNPGAAAELAAGLVLTQVGVSGEVAGVALDLTGAGAVVGVPANAVSAGAIAAGVGLVTMGGSQLAAGAAGDDHVSPMRTGGDPPPARGPATPKEGAAPQGASVEPPGASAQPRIDISDANFAQKTASREFSKGGTFEGRTIDEVAGSLRDGRLTPDDVPVDVIRRDGKVLLLNTRSSLALQEAGIPRSEWRVVDRTGQAGYEHRLTAQLARNKLDAGGTGTVDIVTGRK